MQVKVEDLNHWELMGKIQNGFLTAGEREIVHQAQLLKDQETESMTKAYEILKKEAETNEDIDMDVVVDAMHEHAYSTGLEFHSSYGKFWEPSTC